MTPRILVGTMLLVASSAGASPGRRLIVDVPARPERAREPIARTLYLERCTGGCTLTMGDDDARTSTTKLVLFSTAHVGEFANSGGQIGALADTEWSQLVQCVREVYSPFDVDVTDVHPAAGESFHLAVVAGRPQDVGRTSDILGVAPLANDCSAINNQVSLTFANQHTAASPAARMLSICWTAAQESAHAFGLDHEYEYVIGKRSACNDPMTYRSDCGGQKFFRNEPATCGENAPRACKCGDAQNSHQKLLAVFGAGTPITPPPTVTLVDPAAGGALRGVVTAMAGAQRGVAHVDLLFNGSKWADQAGAAFGRNGQPNPATYEIPVPAALPDGVIDVQTTAYDDLGQRTASGTVTLTKGAPCRSASTCAEGQKCEAGKCFWDPPAGELGASCDYDQFCKSGTCGAAGTCTQACVPGIADACPAGFTCESASSSAAGQCVGGAEGGGCCDVGAGGSGWPPIGIGAAALAFVIRKRRR